MSSDAVRSKALILLLLIHWLLLLPFCVCVRVCVYVLGGGTVRSWLSFAVLCVLPSFVIISTGSFTYVVF